MITIRYDALVIRGFRWKQVVMLKFAGNSTYHQQDDLENHGRSTAEPAAEGPLQGTLEIKLHAWLIHM
jgi:hypothetical protein